MNIRDPIEGWFGSENLLTSISGVKALKFDYIDELGEGFSHGKKNLRFPNEEASKSIIGIMRLSFRAY